MCRKLLTVAVVLPLFGVLSFSDQALFPDNFNIAGSDERSLAIIDGKLQWCKTGKVLWVIKGTRMGDTIQVASRGKWEDWYLTYDAEGKDRTVKLSEKPTPGSYWKVGNKNARPTFLTAAGGKVEHYSLDRGEEVEKVKGNDGQMYRAFKVILAEKPKHIRHVTITVIAP